MYIKRISQVLWSRKTYILQLTRTDVIVLSKDLQKLGIILILFPEKDSLLLPTTKELKSIMIVINIALTHVM